MPPMSTNANAVMGIQDHAMIGNLQTAAMISINGSIESMCIPDFDSPSVFARILDAKKGGHFSITPTTPFSTKQAYLPSSNVLATKFLSERGVGQITDLLVPKSSTLPSKSYLPWLIRRVEVIRGKLTFRVEIIRDDSQVAPTEFDKRKIKFTSKNLSLDVRVAVSGENVCKESSDGGTAEPDVDGLNEHKGPGGPDIHWSKLDLSANGHLGEAVYSEFEVYEGEIVDFVLREFPARGFEQSAKNKGNKATKEMAEELGVDLSTLAKGVSKIRSPEDPVITLP
ncbi:hypothetical protein [Phaffia rhodozyma]|uniref:Trehalase-like N-terminal domain-containing protein n=1 Tax=Phaffia rhodozyma TaxID=264483 RepID=A0A0F7SF10_PHARH|nr:hypothetical protein [Phaffia rhodozyma]